MSPPDQRDSWNGTNGMDSDDGDPEAIARRALNYSQEAHAYAKRADDRSLELFERFGEVVGAIVALNAGLHENTTQLREAVKTINKLTAHVDRLRANDRELRTADEGVREKLDSLSQVVEELEDTKVRDLRERAERAEAALQERAKEERDDRTWWRRHRAVVLTGIAGTFVGGLLLAAAQALLHLH